MIRLLQGDCRDVLDGLPERSVHCVVTSPPYFGLRDYGTASWVGGDAACDHVVGEIRTGLGMAKLGERYSGGGHKASAPKPMMAKDVCPKCAAVRADQQIGLEATPAAYIETMVGVFRQIWRVLRDDGVAWLNLGDSYNNFRSQMGPGQAVHGRDRLNGKPAPLSGGRVRSDPVGGRSHVEHGQHSAGGVYRTEHVETGTRNLRNVWSIATMPFPGAHFAVMPSELAERCIKAGTSEKGCCSICAAPWVRVTEKTRSFQGNSAKAGRTAEDLNETSKWHNGGPSGNFNLKMGPCVTSSTIGWQPTCDCPDNVPVPCTVLDPFSGAGTTCLVADRLGRNATGIDLNQKYGEMARERLIKDAGMFAEIA
jgi:DNA modification methylase